MRQGFSESKGANFVNIWASVFSVELSRAKDLNKDTAIEQRRLKRVVLTRGQKSGRDCGEFAKL